LSIVELPARWEPDGGRAIAPEDWARYERYVGEIFAAFGMDLGTPGTDGTPRRFLRAMFDATVGYCGDPKLRTAFPSERPRHVDGRHSQILEGPISFFSLCEHHALPFHGVAHVAYVAGDEILGISKLTRLVRLYARRFTVQERVGEEIADRLVDLVQPRGVASLRARHCPAGAVEPISHEADGRIDERVGDVVRGTRRLGMLRGHPCIVPSRGHHAVTSLALHVAGLPFGLYMRRAADQGRCGKTIL